MDRAPHATAMPAILGASLTFTNATIVRASDLAAMDPGPAGSELPPQGLAALGDETTGDVADIDLAELDSPEVAAADPDEANPANDDDAIEKPAGQALVAWVGPSSEAWVSGGSGELADDRVEDEVFTLAAATDETSDGEALSALDLQALYATPHVPAMAPVVAQPAPVLGTPGFVPMPGVQPAMVLLPGTVGGVAPVHRSERPQTLR
jgi:hypothetical protein